MSAEPLFSIAIKVTIINSGGPKESATIIWLYMIKFKKKSDKIVLQNVEISFRNQCDSIN